jgi:hypothetical protein
VASSGEEFVVARTAGDVISSRRNEASRLVLI